MKNISVIGIGQRGLAFALRLERVGYNVLGVDSSASYVRDLNAKTLSFEPEIKAMLHASTHFRATTELRAALNFASLIFICVESPFGGGDNHAALGRVRLAINKEKVRSKHIVIESTVMPRYTTHIGAPLLNDCTDTTLSYSPFRSSAPDILIGEGSADSGDVIAAVYQKLAPTAPAHRMNPISAEIAALGINCFLATKIAFANMIGDLATRYPDADAPEILRAIGADNRVGSKYFAYGHGYGGSYLPRDCRALNDALRACGISPIIPEATDMANKLHTQLQAQQCLEALRAAEITAYTIDSGVCYKPNCHAPIIEESQKLVIAKFLAQNGIQVCIKDTKQVVEAVRLEYGDLFTYAV